MNINEKQIDYNNQEIRTKYGTATSIFGCVINLLLFIAKLFFGLLSNSISIITDAINNLTDMGSSIISFIGFKISNKPADKEHPFGHQRVEYITSLIISIIIIVVGIELFSSSISKIINKEETVYSTITIIILIISIILKIVLFFVNNIISKKINSLTLKTTAKDSLYDCIATLLILISAIISISFNINIDGYIGVLLSIFIIVNGILLVKETMSPLIGEKVDTELVAKIVKLVKNKKEVLGVHDIVAHSYGPTKIFMSLHVEVDSNSNLLEIHNVIDNVELEVKDLYCVSLVIHMDPVVLDCDITNNYKTLVDGYLSSLNCGITFHDFRCVTTDICTNIIFDVVLNSDCTYSKEQILKSLNNILVSPEVNVKLIVCFDEDFSTSI